MSQSAATDPYEPPAPADVVARLYEAYAERLTRYCRGQLGSAQEAEDAVQTTFVHAVQALRNGVVPECEPAWLYTIAKNVCQSMHRANGMRHLHAVDVELDALSAPESGENDLVERLSTALSTLPERQQKALVLREWLGLPSREVASRLGMRTSETYALLTRARRSMATALTATTGRTTVAINLGSLLLKLRALLFGGAANTTATATVAIAVAVGGTVVVERAGSDPAPDRTSPSVVPSTPRAAPESTMDTPSMSARPTSRARPTLPSPTRGRGPVKTPATEPSTASGPAGAPGTARDVPEPTPAAQEPPTTAQAPPGPKVSVSTPTREVRVAGRRVRLPRVVPPVAEKLVPPVDVTVDVPVPPEVTEVVDAVEDVLEPLSGVLSPLPPGSPPPALPNLLP
jgi:RNA polymerase sigma-70 factor (ECF subfamily)